MRLEPRTETTLVRAVLMPCLAILVTLILAGILVMLADASPLQAFSLVLKGAAGSQFAILETLTRATPLIFTGLSVAVAFRAKLWNIGAEAQLYIGAVLTVIIGTQTLGLPPVILIALMMIISMIGGSIMLYGPALLKTRFGVDEVVTTLLLNFITLLFVSLLLEGVLKDPMGLGWPQTETINGEARLPRLVQGKRLHFGFVIALFSSIVVWVIMARTVLGYEMRAVGHNIVAARFAGISVNRVLLKTAVISGGLAALAGFSEVAGTKGNLTLDLSPGFGYTGIVVAMLALLHPIGVVFSAVFIAGVFVGADAMGRATGVPSFIADVIVAISLMTMVVAIMLTKFRVRFA
ncbi:MAG: ABC transporter permease [Rhodobacteraceae bacterium]|nr:ABC transporter permease [Paracoccaceae bacterium]